MGLLLLIGAANNVIMMASVERGCRYYSEGSSPWCLCEEAWCLGGLDTYLVRLSDFDNRVLTTLASTGRLVHSYAYD